ncbi:MAG: exosome complex exonuclease Rrp41 [Candidatus Bathyarchaeota archaeon]|nr:MAG: exosome complex exonuclease Rrp41 [Candidatus Bathyarchaeota archaeon]
MSKEKKKTRRKTKKKPTKRFDGRNPMELRPIKIESGVLPNADGSAYIEMGKNKVLVGVFGPKEMHPKRFAKPNMATLRCRYHMSPFSVDPRRSPAPSRRDMEIGMVMTWALEPAIFLDRYPRSVIEVYAEILEADGGTRTACINAATVALVDAGIPMRDLVASCSAGKMDGKLVVDLGDYEDKEGEADVPLAYMPKLEKITLLQMDGVLPPNEFEECINLAIEGCKQIYEIQREALKKKYGISEELQEEAEE